MAIDTSIPRTRRALLAGGLGGAAALVASALGRPLPASAGTDGDVVLGATNTSGATTVIDNTTTTSTVLEVRSKLGLYGLRARTDATDGSGVYGQAGVGGDSSGVYGFSGEDGYGVKGVAGEGTGVAGFSSNGLGVYGWSTNGTGVEGASAEGPGVHGSGAALGVEGASYAGTGIFGFSTGADPSHVAAPPKTGVYGRATQDANARGVWGQSTSGRGVYGQATSGVGLYGSATTGYAIRAVGRLKLDKCAGIATIPAGSDRVTVAPGLDLVSTSAVVGTLQGNAGSASTSVSRCFVDTLANEFAIILTKPATVKVKVAWIVLG